MYICVISLTYLMYVCVGVCLSYLMAGIHVSVLRLFLFDVRGVRLFFCLCFVLLCKRNRFSIHFFWGAFGREML